MLKTLRLERYKNQTFLLLALYQLVLILFVFAIHLDLAQILLLYLKHVRLLDIVLLQLLLRNHLPV